jgi:predicted nucleotide-binding protein
MNIGIEPEDAINKIIDFANQIDALTNLSYESGKPVKEQLNTRIRAFIRATFKDDKEKLQDYDSEIKSHHRVFVPTKESEEEIQKHYLEDLAIMRNHLIGFKDELELFLYSRKKKNRAQSQNNLDKDGEMVAVYGPAIPIPSPEEEYIIDHEGNIGTRLKKSSRVFIVHGLNNKIKDSVSDYLKSLNLEPIILHLQPSLGKTIIEKVEHYSDVGFAVILLTVDDFGGTPTDDNISDFYASLLKFAQSGSQMQDISEKDQTIVIGQFVSFIKDIFSLIKLRARQNVIFEFGYFIGKLGRRKVAALCEEGIERPSDIDGLVYISLDEQGTWKNALKMEIEAAGIETGIKKIDVI